MLDQRRVGLQGRAVERLAGHEQDDEFGARAIFAGQMLPIGFFGQLADMIAQLAGMFGELAFGRRGVALGFQFGRREVGIEGRLGVHRDALAARQPHDEIGAQPSRIARHAGLLGEVAVLQHAGQFHHPLELDFPPASAHGRLAQGLHQTGGLAVQLRQVVLKQGFHLLVERAVGVDARLFDLADALLHLRQRFGDGFHQAVHRLLTRLEFALGALLETTEVLASKFQEALVVVLQRIDGQGLEGIHQPCLRLIDQRQFLGRILPFLCQAFLELGAPGLQPGQGVLQLRAFLGQGRQFGHPGLGRGPALRFHSSADFAFVEALAQGAVFLFQALMQQALRLQAPAQRDRDQGQDGGRCPADRDGRYRCAVHVRFLVPAGGLGRWRAQVKARFAARIAVLKPCP